MAKCYLPAVVLLLVACPLFAQQKDIASLDKPDSAITNYSAFKRSISFAGLLQTRFTGSLTEHVDVNGKNYDPATEKAVTNTFLIKRARLQVKANINDHFSANIMVNFAEFNGNPANKVLENAYIKYSLNRHFNLQAGSFRPFFGIEDALPVDIVRTLDYSNQYYAFGSNGWQSFQIGMSLFGDVTGEGQLPVRYYAGVYNGNNRNQPSDDDDSKNVYGRLEADLLPDFTIGVNAAAGSQAGSGTGSAYGGDFLAKIPLATKWFILLSGEYKNGTSFTHYNSSTLNPKPKLGDFRMQGFYVFPILRFEWRRPRVRAIEFSSRYEYFDEDHKLNSNVRQTVIPNFNFVFADNFYVAIQAGVSLDFFKNDIPLTTTYTRKMVYTQLQIRF